MIQCLGSQVDRKIEYEGYINKLDMNRYEIRVLRVDCCRRRFRSA